ncbi:MAG TPA: hypothetical protein VJ873_08155, partial [bacterium]|nr:hypothetical protein [bacterium]
WGCIHEGNVAKLTEEIRDTLSDAAIWEKIVYSGGQRWVVPAKAWRVLAVGDKIRVTQSPFRRMTVRVERAINKT